MTFADVFLQTDHALSVKFPHYLGIYERHFRPFCGQPVHVLEIGVGGGGFLQVLQTYFGPTATIHGLDAKLEQVMVKPSGLLLQGFQEDTEALRRVCDQIRSLDIVIDDGGHRPAEQLASFRHLFPHLKTPGLYVVEDTQLSYAPAFRGAETFMAYVKDRLDDLNAWFAEPGDPPATDFTKSAYAIHVYLNLVIFEKALVSVSSPIRVGTLPHA